MSDYVKQAGHAPGKLARRAKVFASEPMPWAFYLAGVWALAKIRSAIYSKLLRASGLTIGPRCSIRGMRCIAMGSGVSVYGGLWLEAVQHYRDQSSRPVIRIGDNTSFSQDVHITCLQSIRIGNGVLFGSRVHVSDHNHGRYTGDSQSDPVQAPADRELAFRGEVVIGDNVWIGDNAIILGPVKIGAGAIVGANSIVSGEIPAATMVAGAPARIIKRFDSESKMWKKV